ncbi:MAG: sigma-54 dependent transcriptional regulator [Bacteroidales bacterium]|nr:sigma-54 dependent transcriptional regulator [Bacteroidales bacterium]MCL2739118.1 sigma-54 dependent transcriptional regulator [Bacteroidales bacterium]
MTKKGTLLVVDDNKAILDAVSLLGRGVFAKVIALPSPNRIPSLMEQEAVDVVLLDMNFSAGINSGNEGLYWLKRIIEGYPDIPVVLFTAYADINLAVTAVKEGAFDFVVKPFDNAKLTATLLSALQLHYSKAEVKRLKERTTALKGAFNPEYEVIWGASPAMQQVLQTVKQVAATQANILITGENGCGKEVIAKALHRLSTRSKEIMVSVDMGAVSETLFESELFGYLKGSFTDAKEDRAGKFEAAHRGTLFLDEIGNLSYPLQAKLLAAIQNRQITRIGSTRSTPIDIRLICATNKDLRGLTAQGLFREDLLYRINTIEIAMPPLRARKEDIIPLAEHFLKQYGAKYGKGTPSMDDHTKEKLCAYMWPGNVRELQHTIEKAVILSSNGNTLAVSDFLLSPAALHIPAGYEGETLDEMECRMIQKALIQHNSNLSTTAAKLGISRQTLYNKMKKYGL